MAQLQPGETTLSFLHGSETFAVTTTDTVEPGVFHVRRGTKSAGRWHQEPAATFRISMVGENPHPSLVFLGGDMELASAAFEALLGEGLQGYDRGLAVTEGFLTEALQAIRTVRAITLTGRDVQSPECLNALRVAQTLASTAAEEIRQVHAPIHLRKWRSPWPSRG